MPRNLVLCFDGTNNQYGENKTNVVKLYMMLKRSDTDQLTYYQTGIGTLDPPGLMSAPKRWLIEKIDLANALLLSDHVTAGYRFLMRYYEPGDRIYMFGFSRGAYTARVLAGLIYRVGLLSRGNEELVPLAWKNYKGASEDICCGFRDTFSRGETRIHFLGLWDTVSSIGWAFDPKNLRDTAHNPWVEIVRHAVALDERRAKFIQNLWGPLPNQDVKEVWFAGVHSDVGGGAHEMESGLSKIPLKWMGQEAQTAGLLIDQLMFAKVVPDVDSKEYAAPNPAGPFHESLTGVWKIVEWLPLPWRHHKETGGYETMWYAHRGRPRNLPQSPPAVVDPSVFERKRLVPGYDPPNLPRA